MKVNVLFTFTQLHLVCDFVSYFEISLTTGETPPVDEDHVI